MIPNIKQKAMASEVMDLLERGKALPSTAISIAIHESYWKTLNLLQVMEAEGLIIRDKKKYQTFWKLPDKQENAQITKENETE